MLERYGDIRPAAGYPACPHHIETQAVWDLLDVEVKVGMHAETDSGIAGHGGKRYIKSPTTDSPILPP